MRLKEFFLKLGLISMFCLAIFYMLDRRISERSKRNLSRKPNWIFNHKKQDFDLAFIGSSRCYNHVDATLVGKLTSLKAINLGLSGSSYAENYLILKKFFDNGNKIAHLFLQTDIYNFDPKSSFNDPFHEYEYFPYADDPSIDSLIKENVAIEKYYSWKIPFVRYAEYNHIYSFATLWNDFSSWKPSFDAAGAQLLSMDSIKIFNPKRTKYSVVDEKSLRYLELIISLCKKNDVKLTFFNAPEYYELCALQDGRTEIIKKLKEIADSNDIEFLNFEGTELTLRKGNFLNPRHLNKRGALLFSASLAEIINKSRTGVSN
jgi:hypothetical protein